MATPAWQRKEGKNENGGLNAKGRASAKKEGDEFKASPTRGRITQEFLLRQDGRSQEEVNFSRGCQRPKQSD